jgi:phycocyanobilin lyase beta subunit
MTTEILIKAVEQADSAEGLLEAVEALASVKNVAAIPTLVNVLNYNNPGAAVAAVEGLVNIGEPVVPYLLNNVDDYNYGTRAWMIRVFAGVGDPRSLDLLLKTAIEDFSLSVRRSAVKGIGSIHWQLLTSEDAKSGQQKVLDTLFLACDDGEWVVRYAAIASLQSLSMVAVHFQPQITAKFEDLLINDPELGIKARVKLAVQRF